GESASAFFHLAPGFSWEMRDGGWRIAGDARANAKDIEAQVTVKTGKDGEPADVIIHQSGDICAYAPEFGKRMKKQVMEVRFKVRSGIGGCSVRFIFQKLK
ncbi:hypothetical protein, partial [Otoolea muris]|uniref:hypothetical protein n=1 Tax=Otoolea muris TaxID=2941515 RepID=UPI00203F8B81